MNPAKSIFKYVDLQGTKAILKNGTLLFSSPTEFNDPFDISIQTLFAYDPFDFPAMLDEFARLILSDEEFPEANPDRGSQMVALMRQHFRTASDEERSEVREHLSGAVWDVPALQKSYEDTLLQMKLAFESSGIFCASKRSNNYLLWAHYADKHRGAVLEFVPNIEKDSMLKLVEEVEYSNQRPHLYHSHRDYLFKANFQATMTVLDDYTRRITKTKSKEWEYEEELRLYQPLLINTLEGKRHHFLTYHGDELRGVYLGCRMSSIDRQEILTLARRRNPAVRIFEMVQDPHHYKLSAVENEL